MSLEARDKLNKLLQRREDYFLLPADVRKIYEKQFNKLQKEIIDLKLQLEIYNDELDMFSVWLDYNSPDVKEKYKILEQAQEKKEIAWLRKKYSPESWKSEYVGLVKKEISDEWLAELYYMHCLKRQGYIDCPWETKIIEKEEI